MPYNMDFEVIRYCAEEVERQKDTPRHVYHMLVAWDYALAVRHERRYPNVVNVLVVGNLVRPESNRALHFRTVNVKVGDSYPPHHAQVSRLVHEWATAVEEGRLNAEEAYREFEEIHPLVDGNGRTGKILYNWIKDTLFRPEWPPNFWKGEVP